ncbi:hypothetical protein TI39_contig378g00020 [Zymoseptoria brevis]|uniref:Uncharacterized protein n=1 Tax=Zymoseptoria brevis TaxID=1047168 RepID=A0A0F4GNL7_9PEZI|nr:hypothetical protein TI39_contig378g00020 [Zymoseptoria brevis]
MIGRIQKQCLRLIKRHWQFIEDVINAIRYTSLAWGGLRYFAFVISSWTASFSFSAEDAMGVIVLIALACFVGKLFYIGSFICYLFPGMPSAKQILISCNLLPAHIEEVAIGTELRGAIEGPARMVCKEVLTYVRRNARSELPGVLKSALQALDWVQKNGRPMKQHASPPTADELESTRERNEEYRRSPKSTTADQLPDSTLPTQTTIIQDQHHSNLTDRSATALYRARGLPRRPGPRPPQVTTDEERTPPHVPSSPKNQRTPTLALAPAIEGLVRTVTDLRSQCLHLWGDYLEMKMQGRAEGTIDFLWLPRKIAQQMEAIVSRLERIVSTAAGSGYSILIANPTIEADIVEVVGLLELLRHDIEESSQGCAASVSPESVEIRGSVGMDDVVESIEGPDGQRPQVRCRELHPLIQGAVAIAGLLAGLKSQPLEIYNDHPYYQLEHILSLIPPRPTGMSAQGETYHPKKWQTTAPIVDEEDIPTPAEAEVIGVHQAPDPQVAEQLFHETAIIDSSFMKEGQSTSMQRREYREATKKSAEQAARLEAQAAEWKEREYYRLRQQVRNELVTEEWLRKAAASKQPYATGVGDEGYETQSDYLDDDLPDYREDSSFIAVMANALTYWYNLYRQPPIWIILVPGDLVLLACIIRCYFVTIAGIQHAVEAFPCLIAEIPWLVAETGSLILRLLPVLVNFGGETIIAFASISLLVLRDFVVPCISSLLRATLAGLFFLARHGYSIWCFVVGTTITFIGPYLIALFCLVVLMIGLEVMFPPQTAVQPPQRSALAQRTVKIKQFANARDAAKTRADTSRFRNPPLDKGARGSSSAPGLLKSQILPDDPRSATNSKSTRGESILNDEDFDGKFARVDTGAREYENYSRQQGLVSTGRKKPGTTTRSAKRQSAGSPGESMTEVSEDTVDAGPAALSSRRGLVSNFERGRSRKIDRYPAEEEQSNSTTAQPSDGVGSTFLAYIRKRDEPKRRRRIPGNQVVGPPPSAASRIDLAGNASADHETLPFEETERRRGKEPCCELSDGTSEAREPQAKSSHKVEHDQDIPLPVTDDSVDGTKEMDNQSSKRSRASKGDHAKSEDIEAATAKTCISAAPQDITLDEDDLSATWDYFQPSEEVPRYLQLSIVAASNAAHDDLGPEPRISRSTVTQQDRDDAILAAAYLDLGPSNGLRLRWHNHPVPNRRFQVWFQPVP